MIHNLVSRLGLDEWLSLIGLALAIPPLIGFFFSFVVRVKRASCCIALHEFVLLIRQLWHVVLTLVVVGSVTYLVVLLGAKSATHQCGNNQ